MIKKSQLDYVSIDDSFTPLPKHGHLSEKTAEYAAIEPSLHAGMEAVLNLPDFPAFRELAGDPDAVMPPGGPDRVRDVVTELLFFKARDGSEIELKVYKSPNVLPDATLMIRMHGGGWCVGRHEVDGAENVYAAMNPNIVVVSILYRKAPEHPFPQPLYDAYDGLLWCKQNALLLGVNPERIIISGSSSGANLTAALCLEARDNGISGIVAQVLHFPAVCHPEFFPRDKYEYGSYVQNHSNPVLNVHLMEAFLDAYMPNAELDHRHSPLLASSHKDLPPALIQIGGHDILRDDGFAYAEALQDAGVDVEMYAYKGVPHCFPPILRESPETAQFYDRFTKFVHKYGGKRE